MKTFNDVRNLTDTRPTANAGNGQLSLFETTRLGDVTKEPHTRVGGEVKARGLCSGSHDLQHAGGAR